MAVGGAGATGASKHRVQADSSCAEPQSRDCHRCDAVGSPGLQSPAVARPAGRCEAADEHHALRPKTDRHQALRGYGLSGLIDYDECEKFAEESDFPPIEQLYDVVYEQENYPFLPHKL